MIGPNTLSMPPENHNEAEVTVVLEWMLRQVMAQRGIWTGAALGRLLQDRTGYRLSAPSISALMTGNPKQMKADTLDALCTALEWTTGDLWAHKPDTQMRGA